MSGHKNDPFWRGAVSPSIFPDGDPALHTLDDRGLRLDPSLASPTLRDLDYLERRVQALETRIEKLENRA